MTDNPCNCIHWDVCTFVNYYLKGFLPEGKCSVLRCIDVMHIGESCPHLMTDSQAREYLNADIIKKLDQHVFDIESISDDGYSTRAEGIKIAIALIKGVNKNEL